MTSMRTMKREPRLASGEEELAQDEVVETSHDVGAMGLNSTAAGKAPKLELDMMRVKAGWGRLGRQREGRDASTRN